MVQSTTLVLIDEADLAGVAGGEEGVPDGMPYDNPIFNLASEGCQRAVYDAAGDAADDFGAMGRAAWAAWNGPACKYYGW
jgi:hypothetical protein